MEEAVEQAISKADEWHRVEKEALEVGWISSGGKELRMRRQGQGRRWRNNPCILIRSKSSDMTAARSLSPVPMRRSPGLYRRISMR